MSSALVWNLIKNNNCYKVSQTNQTFSRDPFNPTGLLCQADSGFAQKRSVSLKAVQNKKEHKKALGVALSFHKRQRFAQKSVKENKQGVKRDFQNENLNVKAGLHTAAKVLRKRITNKKSLQKNLNKLVKTCRAASRK